jgi:hypothetical protein
MRGVADGDGDEDADAGESPLCETSDDAAQPTPTTTTTLAKPMATTFDDLTVHHLRAEPIHDFLI